MPATADSLPTWRDTPTRRSVLDFVSAVTDHDGGSFVPPADRVAVFDNDGTLWSEMPLYAQLAFALDRAAELGSPTSPEELRAGGIGAVLELATLTHSGITTEAFDTACRTWMATARHPRTGRSYLAMAYQPMLELLELLKATDFSC